MYGAFLSITFWNDWITFMLNETSKLATLCLYSLETSLTATGNPVCHPSQPPHLMLSLVCWDHAWISSPCLWPFKAGYLIPFNGRMGYRPTLACLPSWSLVFDHILLGSTIRTNLYPQSYGSGLLASLTYIHLFDQRLFILDRDVKLISTMCHSTSK